MRVLVAGGIDWFRWHHGSVSDQKFILIAKRSGASVAEVIAVWACLLEAASASDRRGNFGAVDYEAMDCALGMQDGRAQAIHEAMTSRGVVTPDGDVAEWEKRQPKREDDTAAERKPRALKRCPDDFDADPLRAWAAAEAPRADFGRELAKFRDHTFKTAHSDWPAAFRNWLRRASDDAAKRLQSFQDRKAAEAGKWMNPPSTRTEFDFIDMEAPNAAPLALR